MRNLKKHVFPQRKSRGVGLSLRYSILINMTQNKILLVSGNPGEAKSLVSSHYWSVFLDLSYTLASCIIDEMDPVVPDGLRAPLSAHTFQVHQKGETWLHRLHWLAVKSICVLNNMVNSTTCSTQWRLRDIMSHIQCLSQTQCTHPYACFSSSVWGALGNVCLPCGAWWQGESSRERPWGLNTWAHKLWCWRAAVANGCPTIIILFVGGLTDLYCSLS